MANKSRTNKTLKCMNHDPENSKWGEYAPPGGCDMVVEVDERTTKVLCWRCTNKTTQGPMFSNFKSDEE